MTRQVDDYCNAYVDRVCELDPVAATYFGVSGHDHRVTDLSPDGFAAREALAREALREVAAMPVADEREQVAKDAFLERVALEVEIIDAGFNRCSMSVVSSELHSLRQSFDLMDTASAEGWAAVSARMSGVPSALAGYQQTLREEAAAGRVVARRQYAEIALQIDSWLGNDGAKQSFFDGVAAGYDGGGALASELAAHATAASAALDEFRHLLREELLPLGHESDAVGREHYALMSRSFLGAEVDLDEAYAWGWQELKRIRDDMDATAAMIVPGGTFDDAIAALEADPARMIGSAEEFREWMQQFSDRTLADMAATHFDIAEPLFALECMLAPTDDGGIYYTPPSEDFSRPGRMWWSVPAGTTRFAPWREVTTVFHEGVPGHHLQCAQVVYRADLLNRWQRLICWISGHGEGWALYAERLMEELGYLSDPADKLGMLDGQSFRAARVVVDIGLHCDLEIPVDNPFGYRPGERWDAVKMKEFLTLYTEIDDEMLTAEVNRYLGWAGQAPSYKLGERVWLQARADAEARSGAAFDLKKFHTEALNLGSLGLDPLRSALARL